MSPPEDPARIGEQVRARTSALNARLHALGIYSLSRDTVLPRLRIEDWEKLAALAEIGKTVEDGVLP